MKLTTRETLKAYLYNEGFTSDKIGSISIVIDAIDEIFDHIEAIEAELGKYIEAFKPLNTNAVGILIDSNKELKAKNQELKAKLEESHMRYTKETSRLEQRNGNLEAKLSDIESKKVAEFSGEWQDGYNQCKREFEQRLVAELEGKWEEEDSWLPESGEECNKEAFFYGIELEDMEIYTVKIYKKESK